MTKIRIKLVRYEGGGRGSGVPKRDYIAFIFFFQYLYLFLILNRIIIRDLDLIRG